MTYAVPSLIINTNETVPAGFISPLTGSQAFGTTHNGVKIYLLKSLVQGRVEAERVLRKCCEDIFPLLDNNKTKELLVATKKEIMLVAIFGVKEVLITGGTH